jgi:hypothetical protein
LQKLGAADRIRGNGRCGRESDTAPKSFRMRARDIPRASGGLIAAGALEAEPAYL